MGTSVSPWCKATVMRLVAGALAELRVGDPLDVATDVGPLISATAADAARQHCARLEAGACTRPLFS
jgi:RHH-type proline utilization regulon transcriptional repressor/proline dehydrogenase/delta 1-pyrroline-5-carboxylate dehydrogenase